jgi:transcription termination/antitermination protein NusG
MVENSPAWFALHVKPRHEFLVQTDLAKHGTEVYLPAVNKLSQWKDRKKRVDFPLFPGYLFARVHPVSDDFLGLVKTRGVMRILSTVPGHPTPVPDVQISALKTLLTSDKELDIHPELQAGKAVRIKKGPFESVEGVVSKKGEQFLLHVNIAMLGRCVTVKMFADDVELV